MAMNPRWQVLREVACRKKSGTLTLQLGRYYIAWHVRSGRLVCVSSTKKEHSLVQFFLSQSPLSEHEVSKLGTMVDDRQSFAFSVVQSGLLDQDVVARLLRAHVHYVSDWLFVSSANLFWSAEVIQEKRQFIPLELSFSELLLSCERSSLEIASVLRLGRELRPPLRLQENPVFQKLLSDKERRVVPYLRSASSLSELLHDPYLDTLTCYRMLFLLWISGHLHDASAKILSQTATVQKNLQSRIRSIPADWIFPLTAGAVIGAILVPSSPAPTLEKPSYRVESLQEALKAPDKRLSDKQMGKEENEKE